MDIVARATEERRGGRKARCVMVVPLNEEIRRSKFAAPDSAYTYQMKQVLEASDNALGATLAKHILDPKGRTASEVFDPKAGMSLEVARLERKWGHLFNAY